VWPTEDSPRNAPDPVPAHHPPKHPPGNRTDEEHRSPGRRRIAARFGARPAAPSPAECVMGPGQRNAAQESVKDPTSWASRFLPVERFLTIIM
jgi:hypothetical protein